jgi:2-(3-amino-3-carboxypropyl)histidine synthase
VTPPDNQRKSVEPVSSFEAGAAPQTRRHKGDNTESEDAVQCSTPASDMTATAATTTGKPRRRIIVRRRRRPGSTSAVAADASSSTTTTKAATVDPVVLERVSRNLPTAQYSLEIGKTAQRCIDLDATRIALQMPEGLLLFATALADALLVLVPNTLQQVSVLGDVTYGACCVDDVSAHALHCDLLVHYGHSCLVPLQHTLLPVLYVFVEIQIGPDLVAHMVDCLTATLLPPQEHHRTNSSDSEEADAKQIKVTLLGTVQFRHVLVEAQEMLRSASYANVSIPQVKPLSPGEVLGCTSPILEPGTVCLFVSDGRFHLESTLIANPTATLYRYDPYARILTHERYNHGAMRTLRSAAVRQASSAKAQTFGIILGTLGRQGNPALVQNIQAALQQAQRRSFILLLSEITPAKLQLFRGTVDCWVQVACPRLSIDWGHCFSGVPVLNPHELFLCLETPKSSEGTDSWLLSDAAADDDSTPYPMDYYSQSGGPWSNYHVSNRDRRFGRNGDAAIVTATPTTANEG